MQTGQQLRDDGIQLTLFNEPNDWKERFLLFCERQAARMPTFKTEDLRSMWLSEGNPPPHAPEVWGALSRQFAKRKIGVFQDFVPSVSPLTHGHRVVLYKSLRFK